MELRLYFGMLQRGWWLIALSVLSALNVALVSSYLAEPQYRSEARLIVSPNASLESGRDVVSSLTALDRRTITSTYAEVLNSERVFEEAGVALQLPLTELERYDRSGVVLPEASVLQLSVSGPQPDVAAALANAISQRAIDYVRALDQVFELSFLDMAIAPEAPYSPQPERDVALAVALGLIGGSVLAIMREQLKLPLEALRRRSMMDNASTAYSRRYFQRRLEEEMARQPANSVSLGLVQLDGLHDLVDTLPPIVVNRILSQVTRTLRTELRGNDSVGRWDEATFAVLLPSTPGVAASRTLERIHQALSKPIEIEERGEAMHLAPHVGVATCQGSQPARLLVDQALAALETSRQNGSGHSAAMEEPAR